MSRRLVQRGPPPIDRSLTDVPSRVDHRYRAVDHRCCHRLTTVDRGPTVVTKAVVAGTRWRLDQSDGDTWHWRVSVRGTVAVSTR
ncbi:hypothetical protein Tco_0648269 [Tanacetum coccineum]